MAGIPKVKITFDADFDELKKGVKGATDEVEGFGSKVGDFAKKAGAAFAVAGVAAAAYAGKLLVDGVKSAIEDEAAQAKLATTLTNVTGATNAQIAAVEAQILKTSLLTGKTDDELRPSLARLVTSTKDVEAAQKLQALALDISAGSGKSLEAVSNALAKGYEGNTTALGKLGVGISAAELKTMSFDEVTKALSATFEGQAAKQADTFAGKMDRLKVAFDEGKETVGSFVLDAITPMVTLFVDKVVPLISELSTEIGGTLGPTFSNLAKIFKDDLLPIITAWWTFLTETIIPGITKTVTPIVKGLFSAFDSIATAIKDNETNLKPLFTLFKSVATFIAETLAPALGEILGAAIKVLGKLVGGLVDGFSSLVGFIGDVVSGIKAIISLVKNNPLVKGISGVIDRVFGGGKAAGGAVSSNKSYVVGERGPELFLPNTNGMIVPNNRLGGAGGSVYNITVNGAIDSEGTARTIVDLLNRSNARGTLGANRLAFNP
jgi:phage-related protein